MVKLWMGVVLFGGGHLLPMLVPSLRANLAGRMGEGAYKGIYSLISVVGLVLLGWGYAEGRTDVGANFYEPNFALRHLVLLLVLIGFILIFSNGSKGYIRKWLKHPFSLGTALWATGHLLANGERAVVIIFGMFLVLAIADIIVSSLRKPMPVFVPNPLQDLRGLVVGVVLFLVFMLGFHPYVLGIPVL